MVRCASRWRLHHTRPIAATAACANDRVTASVFLGQITNNSSFAARLERSIFCKLTFMPNEGFVPNADRT